MPYFADTTTPAIVYPDNILEVLDQSWLARSYDAWLRQFASDPVEIFGSEEAAMTAFHREILSTIGGMIEDATDYQPVTRIEPEVYG